MHERACIITVISVTDASGVKRHKRVRLAHLLSLPSVPGYAYDPGCIYINGTGRNVYEFLIQLNRCGTLGGNNKRDVEAQGRDIAGVSSTCCAGHRLHRAQSALCVLSLPALSLVGHSDSYEVFKIAL